MNIDTSIKMLGNKKRKYSSSPYQSKPRLNPPPVFKKPGRYIGQPSALYNSRSLEEKKFIDTAASGLLSTGSTPAVPILLNGIAAGTDFINRIGRKVLLKSIFINSFFEVPVAAGTATVPTQASVVDVVRTMLVYDLQPNAALPALTDILWAFTGPASSASAITTESFNNLNNRDRFIIIMDKKDPVYSGGIGAKYVKKYRKLQSESHFMGTGSTIGDLATGAIYLVQFSSAGVALAQTRVRVRFTDA